MHIVIFSHYFVPEIGAPALRIYETAREWASQGHSVEIVTAFPNHPFGRLYSGHQTAWYRIEEQDGIRVHRRRTYFAPNRGLIRRTIGHLSYLPGALMTGFQLKNADLLLATSPPFFAATAAASIARKRGIPFVLEIRDLWPGIFSQLGVVRNRLLLQLLESWELALYRRADQIVTVTESFKSHISRRGIPTQKIDTIPNGANLAFWKNGDGGHELRELLGLEDRVVVLYVGTMGLAQGLSQLIEAACKLKDRREITFLLVGEGGEKRRLQYRVNQEKLKNVVFRDAVDRTTVRRLYSLADVCAVTLKEAPLLADFIPSKIFEMMAMERPIVAAVSGESARIIHQSGGGIVVEPGNAAGIASAIRLLADRPERRFQLGRAGRAFVEAHHSRPVLARRYLQLLEAVAGK